MLGFGLLGALTKDYNDEPERASRPFDKERSGFVLGEGAVVLILEDLESAQERGAPIYGEIVGYGSIDERLPDDRPAARRRRRRRWRWSWRSKDSGLAPEEIDYVSAHGTTTPGNDKTETLAIKQVFGDHAHKLAVSSPKSMTGHLTVRRRAR